MNELRILAPVDGSDLGQKGLSLLPDLLRVAPVRLRLLSVVQSETGEDLFAGDDQLVCDRNLAEAYVRFVERKLSEEMPALGSETRVVLGDAVDRILEELDEFRADLLVLTTHGRSGVQRWRMGSVADKLLRACHCKTLVVGPGYRRDGELASILVPVDGSALSEKALATGTELAKGLGVILHVVRVVPAPESWAGLPSEDRQSQAVAEAQTQLAALASTLGELSGTRTEVLTGSPADALLEYIESQGIGLVVMTSHGRRGFVRSALGSVTDRLIGGTAPILVVPAS